MVGSKPNHENLEKNTDVKVELGGKELSLVDAIKELEQQNELSGPIEGATLSFSRTQPLHRKRTDDSRGKLPNRNKKTT
ncbi:MAG: hypothetical protein ACR5K9_08710 [Wolbachia sp.]